MKRTLLLGILLVFISLHSITAWTAEYVVPDCGKTIQQLIDEGSGVLSITVKGGIHDSVTISRSSTSGNPNLTHVEIIGDTSATIQGNTSWAAVTFDGVADGVSVTLKNLTISGIGTYGIQGRNGGVITIENCEITGIKGEGISISDSGTVIIAGGTSIHGIERGDSMSAAVNLSSCNIIEISSANIYSNTNIDYPAKGFNGLKVIGATTLTITESKFYQNYTGGAFLAGIEGSTTISNVSFHDNGRYGSSPGGNGLSASNLATTILSQVNAYNNQERGIAIGDSDGLYGGVYTRLTMTGGKVHKNDGGGVRVNSWSEPISEDDSTVRISDIEIYENNASDLAGGLYVSARGPIRLENLNVHHNTNTTGAGGLWISNWSDVVLKRTTISHNTTDGSGAGIRITSGQIGGLLGIEGVTLEENKAGSCGGGIYLQLVSGAEAGLNDISFIKNISKAAWSSSNNYGGGGLYVTFDGTGSQGPLGLANCRFVGNEGDYGAAAYFGASCRVSMMGGEVIGNKAYIDNDDANNSAIYSISPARIATSIVDNDTDYDIFFGRRKTYDNPYIDAGNCWWSFSKPEDTIDKRIYDNHDNTNYGWVNYWPTLSSAPDPGEKASFPNTDCEGQPIPEPSLEGYGTIRGHVVDQADAYTRVGIPGAQVQLFVDSGVIMRLVDATKTDDAGYYIFTDLDIRKDLKGVYPPPLDRIKTRARYTVRVSQASLSDKVLYNDDEYEGRTYYKDVEKKDIGVAAGEVVEVDFVLEPELAKAKKLWIVDILSGYSPNNYKPSEASIAAYVSALESGTMSPVQAEALKRAVQAEYGLVYGYSFANDLADLFLESMGMLVGNLFGEFANARSKADVAKNRVEKAALSAGSKEKLIKSIDRVDVTNKAMINAMSYALEVVFGQLEDELGDTTSAAVTAILKDFLAGLNSTGMKGQGVNTIQEIISNLVKLLKPALMDGTIASYCKTTAETIGSTIEPQLMSWSRADDKSFFEDLKKVHELQRQIGKDGAASVEEVLTLVNATILQKKMQENMEMLGAILTASVIGAEFGQALDKGAKVFQVTKYITNAGAIAMPLNTMFNTIPAQVENVARASFGLSMMPLGLPDATESITRTPMTYTPMSVDTTGWTVDLETAADETVLAVEGFLAALDQDADQSLDALAGIDPPGLIDKLALLELETRFLLARSVTVRSVDATQAINDFIETVTAITDNQARIVGMMVDLMLALAVDEYLGQSDPRRQALINSIAAEADMLKANLVTLKTRAFALAAAVQEGTMPPAIMVSDVNIATSTGSASIDTSPQQLTVTAEIINIGAVAVENVGARLVLGKPEAFDSPAPSMDQVLGSLEPGASAAVSWTVSYTGDLSDGVLWATVQLLESGQEPVSFADLFAYGSIATDIYFVDEDQDGMPNSYETLCGLDSTKNDASDDMDEDGLINIEEWLLGTRADMADTDEDGIPDGDEVHRSRGFYTDPLNDDTDEDGTPDGQDLSPLDHMSTLPEPIEAPPLIRLSAARIDLTQTQPAASVTIFNEGGGNLQWIAIEPMDIVILSHESGGSGDNLNLTLPTGFDFDYYGSLKTHVYIQDISDACSIPRVLDVVVHGTHAHLKGDMDGNEEVDMADAILVLQIISGMMPELQSYPEPFNADINGDGRFDAIEAGYILRKSADLP